MKDKLEKDAGGLSVSLDTFFATGIFCTSEESTIYMLIALRNDIKNAIEVLPIFEFGKNTQSIEFDKCYAVRNAWFMVHNNEVYKDGDAQIIQKVHFVEIYKTLVKNDKTVIHAKVIEMFMITTHKHQRTWQSIE